MGQNSRNKKIKIKEFQTEKIKSSLQLVNADFSSNIPVK